MNQLVYIHWNVDPEILKVGPVTLQYYGILFVTGLVIAYFLMKKIFSDNRIAPEKFDKLLIYVAIGIIAGARLGHCLFYDPGYYLSHPLEMILPVSSKEGGGYEFSGYRGLASHGGAIGLIIMLFLYARKTGQTYLKTLDYIAIVTPVSAFFIRMANLMNSEIIGKPTDVPWAFIFERVDWLPRHPAQLYEAIAYLLIFFLNWGLYKKYGTARSQGFYFGLTICLIFTFRFVVEFVKERDIEFSALLNFDMGQVLSIPFILAGIACMMYSFRVNRRIGSK